MADHRWHGRRQGVSAQSKTLCRLSEIEDGEARGFSLSAGQPDILVARQGNRVFGYVNSCPHVGTPLDFQPDRFMNADGSYLQCHTHGALFEIGTGRCVAGPCAGKSLQTIRVSVDTEGRVRVEGGAQGRPPET
jgi:nitrite reductase/ring-hydroxylating ferredoxin subunit